MVHFLVAGKFEVTSVCHDAFSILDFLSEIFITGIMNILHISRWILVFIPKLKYNYASQERNYTASSKKKFNLINSGSYTTLYYRFFFQTYNTGIKTRVYTQEQPVVHVVRHQYEYTPTHGSYHQQQNSNCDKCGNDYQSSITQQQSYYQSAPHHHTQYQQHTQSHYQQQQHSQAQPQQQPIYEHGDGNFPLSRIQNSRNSQNSQNSQNSINEFYTGCPSGFTGQLPYAYDCRRFLNCWHGRGHIQTCSIGTVFNPETLECDRPDKAKCESALGVLGHSGSSKQNTQTNYRSGRYTGASTETVEVLCSPDDKGLQPHPSDCTRFINCANGNMHIQQCGPGTAYSISMKVCDFKDKVDCTGREGGTQFVAQTQGNVFNVKF